MAAPKQARIEPRASLRLQASLVLIGLTAVTAQIVLLRELLVVFDGNEMSLGLVLAAWLVWTAVGSGLLGRLRWGSAWGVMAGLQVAVGFAFPASILLVRASRSALHALPGEVLGPAAMLAISVVALGPLCLASGWLFAAGARVHADQREATTAAAAGSVYLLEAAGSAAGGIVASIVLVPFVGALAIASLVAALNFAIAALALRAPRARRFALSSVAVVIAVILIVCPQLESKSSAWLWGSLRVLATRDSPYGKLTVIDDQGSRTLYENGLAAFTVPDPAAAEEAVHLALLQHPAPRRVLLIGGGANGSVSEALKYPSLQRLDYVELDPAVLELARSYFPDAWHRVVSDPRVRVRNLDGRLFLKLTHEAYDVIIVNLPDPQTAQLNRFYTVDFFREAAARLSAGGVLGLQVRGSEEYISPELAEFLRCLQHSLHRVFAETVAVPGDTIHLFATNHAGTLASSADVLVQRLRERQVQTLYVREYYLPFRMAPDRMQDLAAQMRPQADTPVNRDFEPVAYYFDVALWSGQFNQAYRWVFALLANLRFARLFASMLALLLAAALAVRTLPSRARPRVSAGWCVAAMGFTVMALEIMLLLGFQAVYGYVYRQLALVIAAFMAGMALGTWQGLRRDTGSLALPGLQVAAAASPLVVYAMVSATTGVNRAAGLHLLSYVVFPALAAGCGLLGGWQFPVAARVFFANSQTGGAGTLYALDLAGACAGALLLSAFLVPVFGLGRTSALIAAVNLVPAALGGIWAVPRRR